MGEKQAAFRVHEPPAAFVFLGAKEAGRPQLRSGIPTAVAIEAGGAGVVSGLANFLLVTRRQIGLGPELAGPIHLPHLAELIQVGQLQQTRVGLGAKRLGQAYLNILELERVGRRADVEAARDHRLRLERQPMITETGRAAAERMIDRGGIVRALRSLVRKAQRRALAGEQVGHAGRTVLPVQGAVVVQASPDPNDALASVGDIHAEIGILGDIPDPGPRS